MQPGLSIGILGGGQLARMLALRGQTLGFKIHILSESADDPAAQVTRYWTEGSTADAKQVHQFCKGLDFVTFESELIPAEVIKNLTEFKNIFPGTEVLAHLQDRKSQKEWLAENKIATSPFLALHENADLHDARKLFGPLVVKKRLGGYDGKGTYILKTLAQLEKFLEENSLAGHEFIAEKWIPFKRELALQIARNSKGQIVFLPMVEITQKDNRLDVLQGPVTHRALPTLKTQVVAFLKKINYVGVIAFELFDWDGKLVVNEIAPRVHNSGHASIEALSCDQFSLHLLAITGQALPAPQPKVKFFAMTNLIGNESAQVEIPSSIKGQLHWYGKKKNSAGRKMGHVTYLGNSASNLVKTALAERKKMRL